MSANQTLEVLLLLLITVIQLSVFFAAFSKAERLRRLFKHSDKLQVRSIDVSIEALSVTPLSDLMSPVSGKHTKAGQPSVSLHFIQAEATSPNRDLNLILDAVNTTFLKSRHISPTFQNIRDLIDAKTDSLDHQINLLLPIPLYLGLIGTMSGIIIGLMGLDLTDLMQTATGQAGFGVEALLGGVKIAMIASALGLILTVLNAGVFYRTAKGRMEDDKSIFYSFVQTEVLPLYSSPGYDQLDALQNNLRSFNDAFGSNVGRLQEAMAQTVDVARSQKEMFAELEKVGIAEIVTSNAKMLRDIRRILPELEHLGEFLNQINGVGQGSIALTQSLNEVLLRTETFESWLAKHNESAETNRQLLEFLRLHYSALEARAQVIQKAVAEVDDVLANSLSELRKRVEDNINIFERTSASIDDRMQQTLHTIKEHLEHKIREIQPVVLNEENIAARVTEQMLAHSTPKTNTSVPSGDALAPLVQAFETHASRMQDELRKLVEGIAKPALDTRSNGSIRKEFREMVIRILHNIRKNY